MSILSERRAIAPYGMAGGACASKGLNLLLRPIQEDDKEPTAGNNSIEGSMSKKRRLVHSSDDSKNNADVVGSGGSFRTVNIGSKSTVSVDPGDRLVIMSPGGGGYGAPSSSNTTTDTSNATTNTATLSSLSVNIRISGSLQDYTSMQESV